MIRLALDLSRKSRNEWPSPDGETEAKKRKYRWTALIVALLLVASFSGYMWFLKNRKPDRYPGGSDVVTGGRVAARLSALLDQSHEYGWSRVEEEFSPVGHGRWDPFKTLLPDPVQIVPVEPRTPIPALPEPEDSAPCEPALPKVRLTGVLKSGDRAIALLSVDGRSVITRVGDAPFDGAEVRSIDDKSITISFGGTDFTYQLGGERR